ncbi:MAG: PQQ-like beta-propeller repeat protein [Candidatus Nealsonbacteria bacterium]|nr:PQQ-like beta-propeller repeat protein [Candidatus Nealsonbacteria bacterium]
MRFGLSVGLIVFACTAFGQEVAPWVQVGEEFSIDTIRPQSGWIVEGTVAPGEWKPVVQPNLAEQIQDASQLTLKDVAPPPKRCWVGHRPYLVPNPDGKSWDMIYPYYNKYRGVQEVVIHDFGSGETRRQVLSTGGGDSVLTREPIGFHMQPSFYTEGKLIFEMYGTVVFVVYDPAVDRFIDGVKPFGDEVVNGRCVLGNDGMIYGMGWPKDKSGFVAYCFNPKNHEAKRFKTFGPPNEHRRELYREVRMFGDWIYAAIGAQPWHLAAFNFKTGEGRLLGATEEIIGDGNTLGRRRIGGGMGWYDPTTGKLGGIPLEDHRIFWMISAADGRYIVLSSKCDGKGQLFVWDTQTHEFCHKVDPPQGATRAGPIVEAIPGLVLGHTDDAEGGPLLYGFDPASGKILWTKSVPSPPITAFSQVRRQADSFRRGPNGYIWTFFDKTLVRIDPRNARVEPVGKTEPAQLAFAAGGVYIAGGPMLRRIEGIAVGKRKHEDSKDTVNEY